MSDSSPGRWTRSRWLVTALAVLVLAGCGFDCAPPYVEVAHPNPTAAWTKPQCPRSAAALSRFDGWGEQLGAGDLPREFRPIRVLACTWETTPIDGKETVQRYAMTERGSTVDPAALVGLLGLPDQDIPPQSCEACSAVGTQPEYLILVDAQQRAVVPRLPQEPCGQPRAEIKHAISALELAVRGTFTFEAP